MEMEDEEEEELDLQATESDEEESTNHPSNDSTKSTPSKIVLTPELIAEEKTHVIFEDDKKSTKRTSKFWSSYHIVEGIDLVDDISKFPGLTKLHNRIKTPNCICAVCKICFEEPTKSLWNCTVVCTSRQVSNARSHIRNIHPEEFRRITESPVVVDIMNKQEEKKKTIQKRLEMETPKAVLEQLHYKIYSFINDAGISARNAYKEDLYDILYFTMKHATTLSKVGDIGMGPYRYHSMQLASFASMVGSIKTVVAGSRLFYLQQTGTKMKFINVAHDIWDLKNREIVGYHSISLHPSVGSTCRFQSVFFHQLGRRQQYARSKSKISLVVMISVMRKSFHLLTIQRILLLQRARQLLMVKQEHVECIP